MSKKYIVKLEKTIEKTVVIEASSREEADRLAKEGEYLFAVERLKTQDQYKGYEYVSDRETTKAVITSEDDLKKYYNTNDMERFLFKSTACGCAYLAKEDYVSVSGYAEGCLDAECQSHTLSFPFAIEEWEEAVQQADREGCELYDEYHNDEEFWIGG